jgi:hypothetical protein
LLGSFAPSLGCLNTIQVYSVAGADTLISSAASRRFSAPHR